MARYRGRQPAGRVPEFTGLLGYFLIVLLVAAVAQEACGTWRR